jgi:uncharacterized membrane protein YbhN (UPF0104 family)
MATPTTSSARRDQAAAAPAASRLRRVLRLAGAALAAAFFVWLFTRLPLADLAAQWQALPLDLLLAALAGQFLSYALRAQRVRAVLPGMSAAPLPACLRVVLLHNAANLLLPMRSGEASFPLLLKQRFGISASAAVGALVWLRIADLSVLCAVGLAAVASAGGIARLGLAVGLALFLGMSLPFFAWLAARVARRLDVHGRFDKFLLAAPESLWLATRSVLITWACWLPKLAALGFVLAALAQAPLALGLLGVIGGDLSTVLPVHAPGGVGSYEAGVLALVLPQTPIDAHWVGAAINLHALLLGFGLALGGIAAIWPRSGDTR